MSLAAASPGQQSLGDAAAAASEPTAQGTYCEVIPGTSQAAAEADSTVPPSTTEQTPFELLAQGTHSSHAMPPPSLPQSNQTGPISEATTVGGRVLGESRSPDVQSGPDSTWQHPNKRRRVERGEDHNSALALHQDRADQRDRAVGMTLPWTTIAFSDLITLIDKRIADVGGEQNLTPDVERPRFQILKDACGKRDVFYLHLHSLFCLWSADVELLPPLPSYDLDAIYRGFAILETVLKKNSGFTRDNLGWCAAFPYHGFNYSSDGATKVADFLTALSLHWPSLHQDSFNRHYPFLMDELVGRLHCYSPIMQNILFTASRRRLGIHDGSLGLEVHRYFDQDQRQHLDEYGVFRSLNISNNPRDIERRNQALIRVYRGIVSRAKAEKEEQQRLQQHALQTQQQNFQREQIMMQQHAIRAAQQVQQFRHSHMVHTGQQLSGHQQAALPNGRPNFSPLQTVSNLDHQWAQNHMSAAMVNNARRISMTAALPNARMAAQLAARPHSSGPYSGAQSPAVPQTPFSPHSAVHQQNQLPQSPVLPSSPTTPTLLSGTMMQAATNGQNYGTAIVSPRQYQFHIQQQAHSGQDQSRVRQYAPQGQFPAQWSSGTVPTTFIQSPHVPLNPSLSPQLGGPQQTWVPAQPRMPLQSQRMQPGSAPVHNNVGRPMPGSLLVPPQGQIIDRSEYPHSHHEKKSLLMSLHQAHARSPDRTRRIGDADERYYQSVHSFAVAPFRLSHYHELQLEVSSDEYARLCKKKSLPLLGDAKASIPVHEYTNGSLRFRIRCCRLQSDKQAVGSAWVTKEMMWPDHIFIHFNEQKLAIRRGTHNGKDLPVELTDFVLSGTNKLKVALPKAGPTAPDKRGNMFYLAVEVIETASHSELMNKIKASNRIDREETLKKIRSRVTAAPDEDGIAVIDRTGDTAHELSIDLSDPFSANIFTIPSRGETCTHMECFDLETWLITRPSKQKIKCGHKDVCTCPKRLEPSDPDKWKCPICFGDARPGSLRIDSFLESVRKQLEEQNKLDTKSILVAMDGSWRPVDEPDDDDDGSDGDSAATQRNTAALRKAKGLLSKSASVERAPVEIIELD